MLNIYITTYQVPESGPAYKAEHTASITLLARGLADSGLMPEGTGFDDILPLLANGENGKPYLEGFPDVHFNISNSQGIAVCAVSDHPVGIDLEKLRPFHDRILRKVLSVTESEFFNQFRADEPACRDLFFRFWTLKEAYVKYLGTGLVTPLNSFSYDLEGADLVAPFLLDPKHEKPLRSGQFLQIEGSFDKVEERTRKPKPVTLQTRILKDALEPYFLTVCAPEDCLTSSPNVHYISV